MIMGTNKQQLIKRSPECHAIFQEEQRSSEEYDDWSPIWPHLSDTPEQVKERMDGDKWRQKGYWDGFWGGSKKERWWE